MGQRYFSKIVLPATVFKRLTGPKLAGVESRGHGATGKNCMTGSTTLQFMQSDPYTQGLKQQYGGVMMTGFPQLSEKEIDAIVDYINKAKATSTSRCRLAMPSGGQDR